MPTVETDFMELSSSSSWGKEDNFYASHLGYIRDRVINEMGRQGPGNIMRDFVFQPFILGYSLLHIALTWSDK